MVWVPTRGKLSGYAGAACRRCCPPPLCLFFSPILGLWLASERYQRASHSISSWRAFAASCQRAFLIHIDTCAASDARLWSRPSLACLPPVHLQFFKLAAPLPASGKLPPATFRSTAMFHSPFVTAMPLRDASVAMSQLVACSPALFTPPAQSQQPCWARCLPGWRPRCQKPQPRAWRAPPAARLRRAEPASGRNQPACTGSSHRATCTGASGQEAGHGCASFHARSTATHNARPRMLSRPSPPPHLLLHQALHAAQAARQRGSQLVPVVAFHHLPKKRHSGGL